MRLKLSPRIALLFSPVFLCVLIVTVSFGDEITLQNGGVLRGKVTTAGKNVAVTSSQGIRVVVERSSVQKIARNSSAAASDKPKLTTAEKAWLSKIRKLISRVEFGDGETRRLAVRDLRAINDPAAIPALMQTLRTSDDDATRLLYVRILGDMPGSKAVIGLVEEALFDSSDIVRDAAQEASMKVRAEYVRPFYGQALRFPNREVVCRAAKVLSTVGNEENVPDLIESLLTTTVDVVYRPSGCQSRVDYLANAQGGVVPLGNGTYGTYQENLQPVFAGHYMPNPQVMEALEAITKQPFRYNRGAWRRWWKSEQLAQNSKAP
jgi:HEAT repeat protein